MVDAREMGGALSNKGMKLTKLPSAPLPVGSAAGCPRRTFSDAGTASQPSAAFGRNRTLMPDI